ncbi:hypothetical protein CV102_02790 [Natronococcus pandeyae]|uniref:Uncharacterized protein n=1 Tax=Natronococcus pandeyae TaxID=2055836 RepID=A0A8J8Q7V7_9EURY|nr:hypothetical protein [Natronococcus pandeyae]TYL40512.1 hypothetical protein CV102_02790 [Natronococcus pandeyae]
MASNRRQTVRSPLEWFHDDDGWARPDGRNGEFLALLVGLPAFAWFASGDLGGLALGESWLAVSLGVCCGFAYAAYYRQRLLEVVHLPTPTVLFVLAAATTVLGLYALRFVSPLHEGIEPPRRGAEPPAAIDPQ